MSDLALRKRFLDDLLLSASKTTKQIVLLACGCDFRPYRLSFSDNSTPMKFFLLDVDQVLHHRRHCFRKFESPPRDENCQVIEIACDLADEEWSRK